MFDVDYEPADPPPVLFHAIRVPCACGRSLDAPIYTFFPSAVFAHGTCPECGPRSAIFAPHVERTATLTMPEKLASTAQRLIADLARVYRTDQRTVIEEFFTFLAAAESQEPAPTP